jgi:hypothetical protein
MNAAICVRGNVHGRAVGVRHEGIEGRQCHPMPPAIQFLFTEAPYFMSTATTTSHDTGQHTASRSTSQPNNSPVTQPTPNAAQTLRTTMAAVRVAFTWLGVRKTLAPEQRTTAARVFHADRELHMASKMILNTWADRGPVG